MDLSNLTINEFQELFKFFEKFNETKQSTLVGKKVIIRTYSAGVHYGTLLEKNGKEVHLANAKRIWRWEGANTLHEISLYGVLPTSKISEPVEDIYLTESIEIIPCTEKAIQCLDNAMWAK